MKQVFPTGRVRRMKPSCRDKGNQGFSLIELLVATIAGLFVVLAAFILSRGSTRVFSSENRMGTAQFNLRVGIERLRSDIERAGFLSSPNALLDPDVCPKTFAPITVPLQSVTYYKNGSGTEPTLGGVPKNNENGLYPDSLVVQGNFASNDQYLVAAIDTIAGSGYTVTLQSQNGAIQRLLSASEVSSSLSVAQTTFPSGQLVRITNPLGTSQYAIVSSVAVSKDAVSGKEILAISLEQTPNLSFVAQASLDKRCGLSGYGLGSTVNPVQIVRYDVRSMLRGSASTASSNYAWAYPNDLPTDEFKYDLVRRLINPKDGTTIANSETIVAEYVVDLAFAFTADTSAAIVAGAAYVDPMLVEYPFDDAGNAIAGINTLAGSRPQRVRSVRYRMTTRTREPDRSVGLDDAGPGLIRYQLGPKAFSRARTLVGEVTLVNQMGARW